MKIKAWQKSAVPGATGGSARVALSIPGLTLIEVRVYARLLDARRGAVSRGDLLLAGWGGARMKLKNATRKVDVAVSRLRAKGIEIGTMRGAGYFII